MQPRALPLYAAAHFWVDFSCAVLVLGRLDAGGSVVTALILYNFFAFAVQMPVGLLADALGGAHRFAALGCSLTALAWALPGLLPAAICAGLGNACFHVGGGLYTLNAEDGSGPLGLFVSPGAMGIYLGGLSAVRAALPGPLFWLVLLALGGVLALAGRGAPNAPLSLECAGGPGNLLPLICLFAVVLLRSFLGNLFAFPWRGELGLALACAVVGGKAAGGLLADRFGQMRTAWISLALAVPCFLCSDGPVLGLAAVCLFNMTMPLTLWGAARYLRGAKGLAFGLLTFALFLGTLPVLLNLPLPAGGAVPCAVGAACSLPLLALGLRRAARRC